MAIEIPRNAESVNIFTLIMKLLDEQKRNSKIHGEMLALSIVERQNLQYQKHLDDWSKKSDELKEARAMEFEELKDSLNSKGGWFIGGLLAGSLLLGVIAGAVVAGPGGAAIGAKLAMKIGAGAGLLAGGTGVGVGIGVDKSKDDKVFFDEKPEIDPLKSKKRDNEMERISRESKHIQDLANVKQGEISRTMQMDVERAQQVKIALSNMFVKFNELLGRTTNMMR